MAKVNINKATREELVEVAGLRPQVAEAVLKMRDEQGGRIKDVEALRDLKGVGEATLDQLKDVLTFGAVEAKETAEKAADAGKAVANAGAEGAKTVANATAQTAKTAADVGAEATRRVAERTAEVTSISARGGVEAAQRLVGVAADAEKRLAHRSNEVATDLGRLAVNMMNEQLQANVETLQALARAKTWREALEVQNDYVRGNIERATQGASRYVEAVTRLVAGAAKIGRDEVKKAA